MRQLGQATPMQALAHAISVSSYQHINFAKLILALDEIHRETKFWKTKKIKNKNSVQYTTRWLHKISYRLGKGAEGAPGTPLRSLSTQRLRPPGQVCGVICWNNETANDLMRRKKQTSTRYAFRAPSKWLQTNLELHQFGCANHTSSPNRRATTQLSTATCALTRDKANEQVTCRLC